MSEITLEAIEAKQTELAALIAKFKADAPRVLKINGADITLVAGEYYAGEVLNHDGSLKHRLVFVSISDESSFDFDDAQTYASENGGAAPDVQEAALLIANCRQHLPTSGFFWTSKRHETDASYAWDCSLISGGTGYGGTSARGRAVVVRRLIP